MAYDHGILKNFYKSHDIPKPYSAEDALRVVSGWIDAPNTVMLLPEARHFLIFKRLVKDGRMSGAKLMDAHIAALAIEHGATIATADRDFRLFNGLKTINPLANR